MPSRNYKSESVILFFFGVLNSKKSGFIKVILGFPFIKYR